MQALTSGTLIGGKYRVANELGVGGFGITYLCQDEQLHRLVALKEFAPIGLVIRGNEGCEIVCSSSENEAPFRRGLENFFVEGQTLAKFDHPNIVRVYDVLRENNTAYLAMEYLEGQTLSKVLEENGPLAETQALDVLEFILDALRSSHSNQVWHCDVKPDNVYLTSDGKVMLLDFGGAKQLSAQADGNEDAFFSPGYAPPELHTSDIKNIGPWTDVYSFAATLYRTITGQRPMISVERSIAAQALEWPAIVVSPKTKAAIEKAMSLEPTRRFSNIKDLHASLPFVVVKPPSVRPKFVLSVTAAILSVLGIGWFLWESQLTSRTKEGVVKAIALEGLRDRLSAYHATKGRFPNNWEELGGERISPDNEISEVSLEAGELTLTLNILEAKGHRIQLRPTGFVNGRVELACWASDLPEKYVPKEVCKYKP
jgi:serine/threonine protein kinase